MSALLHRPAVSQLLRYALPKPVRAQFWELHRQRHLSKLRRGRVVEPGVCRAIRRHLKPGMTGLDIGANRGLISLLMADRVGPQGQVVAFEPYHLNINIIHQMLASADFDARVEVVPKVVSDGSTDEVRLYFGRGTSQAEINIFGRDIHGEPTEEAGETVPATSIDAFLAPHRHIHFAKIDVEGAEGLVLAGMQRTIQTCRPTMVIELHGPEQWREVTKLADQGYQLLGLDERPLDLSADFPAGHTIAKAA